MVDYVWKGSFLLNGANCKAPINMNDWLVENIDNKKVRVTKTLAEKVFQEYTFIEEKFKKEMEQFLNAAATGLFFNLDANSFPSVTDFKVSLSNEAEIIASRQQLPMNVTLSYSFYLTFREAQFGNIFTNIVNIDNSPYKSLLDHYLSLFRQGLTYSDSFDKFFTLWRAFNALFNFHSLKVSEPEKVEETIHLLLNQHSQDSLVNSFSNVPRDSLMAFELTQFNSNFFEYLVSLNLTDKKRRNRSSQLNTAITNGNTEEIIKKAMLCLYVLRCNYAHGSDCEIMENEHLFQVTSNFLRMVLCHLLNSLA